jgi:hypothetical protein
MILIRLICFALLTLATPFAGSIARAAEPAATPTMQPAPVPLVPAEPCGPTGAYVASLNACVQAAAAQIWQTNLKTGDVSRVAFLAGLAIVHRDVLHLGFGLYCGVGVAENSPNAAQCDLLASAGGYGVIGFGVQSFRANGLAVYQGLFSIGLQLPGVK